jgi:hypoxanthine phosphoribosyltransferase
MDLAGTDVIVVDDILDTGRTLNFARQHLRELGARSVRTCALLDKPARRVLPFEADYIGFTIEDRFVVGYGLDYDGHYRELPHIACVTFLD